MMRASEFQDFRELLANALSFYRQDVTPFMLDVWWQACQGFELGQVRKAMTTHAMDPERGQFQPKPADIVRQLQGTHTDRSLMAWGKVYEAMARVGAYSTVAFDDPCIHLAIEDMGGWPKLCRSTSDELPFVQKRFCDTYKAYSGRQDRPKHPPMLLGAHDAENARRGYRSQQPALIGSPATAQAVIQSGEFGARTTPIQHLLSAAAERKALAGPAIDGGAA
jgi:hypothetical protein